MPSQSIPLQEIRTDFNGFARLTQLAAKTDHCVFQGVKIDMARTSWLDANMCAPFGAILYKAARRSNTITLSGMSPGIETILRKNGFLSNYGREKIPDTHGTTIEYRRFDPKDDRDFAAYVASRMVGKGIPTMSPALRKKFLESLFEIFSNAATHSETKYGIFACGQFFPQKKRIDFSIADLGIGIRRKIEIEKGLLLSSEKAISWAMEGSNTTRSGAIPGGLGLKLLRQFIELNKGCIQIVSDTGYWQLSKGIVTTNSFPSPFPGTVVNIQIRTDDTQTYILSSETKHEDIF
jgi:hypothetical protein